MNLRRDYVRLFLTKKSRIILLSLGIIILILPFYNISAAQKQATIYSLETEAAPTIDGKFTAGEWASADTPKKIVLYDLRDQYKPVLSLYLRSVYYNATQNFFLGFEIPDDILSENDKLVIAFNTSLTPLALNAASFGISFDDDHDAKTLWIHNNAYSDGYTAGIGFRTDDDPVNSGTVEGNGKATHNGTYIIVEMIIPLDSGDAPGHDVSLAVGDEVDIFLVYTDGENETDYSHWRVEDNDYDYNVIHIGPQSTLGIPFWLIFPVLTSIVITGSIISRRKKRN